MAHAYYTINKAFLYQLRPELIFVYKQAFVI
jgi:hypothetical protein